MGFVHLHAKLRGLEGQLEDKEESAAKESARRSKRIAVHALLERCRAWRFDTRTIQGAAMISSEPPESEVTRWMADVDLELETSDYFEQTMDIRVLIRQYPTMNFANRRATVKRLQDRLEHVYGELAP